MLRQLLYRMMRTKTLDDVKTDVRTSLHRCLTTFDLTMMGVGSMIGSGIYILVGIAAKELAGPAIVISFLLAAVTVFLGALCLAEFASRVPRTGSTYLYTYYTLGEFLAFLIGWSTVLASILGGAMNARAWSSYLDSLFEGAIVNMTHTYIGKFNLGPPIAEEPDFVAVIFMAVITMVVAMGANCSSRFTSVFTILNISVLVFVIIVGFIYAQPENWTSPEHGGFMPFGFTGVLSGSTACYFAFSGYEVIAVSVEEAKDPKKSIVRAFMFSLLIVTLLYVGASCAITLVSPLSEIDSEAPLPSAFAARGLIWAKYILSIGPLCGITTTLLSSQFCMVRIVYAIANDGLFFPTFSRVNSRTKVPLMTVIIGGFFMAVFAFCFELKDILGFSVILNLLQYVLLSAGVIILRYQSPRSCSAPKSPLPSFSKSLVENPCAEEEEEFKYTQISDMEDFEPESPSRVMYNGKSELEIKPLVLPHLDGLQMRSAFQCFSKISCCGIEVCVTPAVVTICVLMTVAVSVGIYERENLLAGTWWAIVIIAVFIAAVLVIAFSIAIYNQNSANLAIKVPCVPWVPLLSMFASILLIASNATKSAWVGTAIVFIIGVVLYFAYGIRHSAENSRVCEIEMDSSTYSLLKSEEMDNEDADEI